MTDVPAAGSINAHVTPAAAAGIAVAAGDPGGERRRGRRTRGVASVQCRLQINASVIRAAPAASAAAAAAAARLLVTYSSACHLFNHSTAS